MCQFLVAAEVYNADDELVKMYNIPENHEGLELRLFVGKSDEPIIPTEDDEDLVVDSNPIHCRLSGLRQIQN